MRCLAARHAPLSLTLTCETSETLEFSTAGYFFMTLCQEMTASDLAPESLPFVSVAHREIMRNLFFSTAAFTSSTVMI